MRKYLPLIFLGLGFVVVLIAVIFLFKNKNKKAEVELQGEETFIELPFDKRPVISLTPTDDGHYLSLLVNKININKAKTMDYELLYTLPTGITQGVPGTTDISGISEFKADLLLGSESSGKFRYDEGVETGILTLWFRDEDGKLITKMSSDFRMLSGIEEIISSDEQFKFNFKSKTKKGYYLVMNTIGIPNGYGFDISAIKSGPYGLFSSETKVSGEVDNSSSSKIFQYKEGRWSENASEFGIFVII